MMQLIAIEVAIETNLSYMFYLEETTLSFWHIVVLVVCIHTGPIITDSYAVIQKKVTKEGPCFAIQDVAVEDEVDESSSEGSHVKSSLNFSNEVYNLSLPVKVPDTVLIDNDLYESCNEDSETDDEKEVVEFIDNDLYSTG